MLEKELLQALGEAIERVTHPVRMNYSILGNTDHYLHAHVYPRYYWETPERLCRPAWSYFQDDEWTSPKWEVSEKNLELAENIKQALEALMETC
jgi:diadenosine tetraphosphate (Ap4A) HIT family hydrolase